jgi:hypothetical protein
MIISRTLDRHGTLMRRALWLLPAVWFVLVIAYFAFAWVLPYRTPPSWDETEYLRGTLALRDLLWTQPARLASVLVNGDWCIWHASLVGSAATLPFWLAGAGYMPAYGAALVQCALTVALVGIIAARMLRDTGMTLMGGIVAALCFGLAPMTLALGSMIMAEIPCAWMTALALLAYLHARRRDHVAAWLLAGVAAFATIYARAERGLVFIACLTIAVWVDAWRRGGWRGALETGMGMAGCGLLLWLWLERWCPPALTLRQGYVVHGALLTAALAMCANAVVQARGARAMRGPLLFSAVICALLAVWLSWSSGTETNAQRVLAILAERNAHGFHGILTCYVWKHFALNYCGNPLAVPLKVALFIAGLQLFWRAWPGGLALLALYVLQAWKADLEVARFLFPLHLLAALAMGCGAVSIARWCARRFAWRPAPLALVLALCLTLTPGVIRRACHAFERCDVTFMPTFDQSRALWQVLETVTVTLPARARFSVASQNPMAFSYNTLMTHGRLLARDWQPIGWPPTVEEYLLSPAFDYHILLGPGAQPSPYFYHHSNREEFAHRQQLALQSGHYVPATQRSFDHERMTLFIVKNRRLP